MTRHRIQVAAWSEHAWADSNRWTQCWKAPEPLNDFPILLTSLGLLRPAPANCEERPCWKRSICKPNQVVRSHMHLKRRGSSQKNTKENPRRAAQPRGKFAIVLRGLDVDSMPVCPNSARINANAREATLMVAKLKARSANPVNESQRAGRPGACHRQRNRWR